MATLKNGEFIDDVLEYYESTEAERTGSPVDKEIKLMKSNNYYCLSFQNKQFRN